MTAPHAATWVLDPWESQALSLRVGRVRIDEPHARVPDLTDAWRQGVDVVYVDAAAPLIGLALGADACFVGILREMAIGIERIDTAPVATPLAHQRPPGDVSRFDLGGRYERDPRLHSLGDRVYRRWVEDACRDPDREVWTLDDDAGLLVLAHDAAATRIQLIGVDRGHRGHGLGSALVRLALARAAATGSDRLVVGGYAHNEAAMQLYEACGLRECTRRWRYHLHRPEREAPR